MINRVMAEFTCSSYFFFLWYFIIVMAYYALLAVVGFIEEGKRTKEGEQEDYQSLYSTSFTVPVSIIIPARNEQRWVVESVSAALLMRYPQFEVIVVDDGSTDKTLGLLNAMLKLKPVDVSYMRYYLDGRVREIFKSTIHPNVTVIAKSSGNKKAGALNAGLNVAKYKYVCVIDADTVLEPDALMKVMAHVQKDPEKIIGIGSYFGLSNWFRVRRGKILERRFSYRPIIAYQNLEYIRVFIGSRIAWSRFNSMPIISGGFAVWRRDILFELGGYSKEYTCEDLEFTFRARDYVARNKEKGYRIMMLPYTVGWTEGPGSIRSLILQRNRWQRVLDEAIVAYKYMLFNPKFGSFGFLTFPYLVIYEALGVFFELASLAIVSYGWISGLLDRGTFFAFLAMMVLTQLIVTLLSVLAFVRSRRFFGKRYLAYLVLLSFFEFLFYRPFISIARIWGTLDFFRNVRGFDQYVREKRPTR